MKREKRRWIEYKIEPNLDGVVLNYSWIQLFSAEIYKGSFMNREIRETFTMRWFKLVYSKSTVPVSPDCDGMSTSSITNWSMMYPQNND